MKSTGIVRTLDGLGRVVIPIEIRRTLNWKLKNKLKFLLMKIALYCVNFVQDVIYAIMLIQIIYYI